MAKRPNQKDDGGQLNLFTFNQNRYDNKTPITLTQYGRMAEKHWREFRPNMVAEMEVKGVLQEMLLEAEEKTRARCTT